MNEGEIAGQAQIIRDKLRDNFSAADANIGWQAVNDLQRVTQEAKKEFLNELQMVWAAEYTEHGELNVQLWPLDKRYWGTEGTEKYKPYIDPWKTAELFIKWFGSDKP